MLFTNIDQIQIDRYKKAFPEDTKSDKEILVYIHEMKKEKKFIDDCIERYIEENR